LESEPSNFELSRGEEGEVTITFKKKRNRVIQYTKER